MCMCVYIYIGYTSLKLVFCSNTLQSIYITVLGLKSDVESLW